MELNGMKAAAGRDFNNCRYCPQFKDTCQGNASDCLCLRCPRNLGQCIKVRYCRETESILDFAVGKLMSDDDLQNQLESYFKRME